MKVDNVNIHPSARATEDKMLGYRDVKVEYERFKCSVEGEIPKWIKGKIYKQCGGAYGGGRTFLDGLAHVVVFDIKDGKAYFSNKYLRTPQYENFINNGIRKFGAGMSEYTPPGMLENLSVYLKSSLFHSENVKYRGQDPNVSFWPLESGAKFGGVTEGKGHLCSFDLETLKTLEVEKCLSPQHKNGHILTNAAHFLRENENGGYHGAVEMVTHYRLGAPDFSFHYTVFYGDSAPFKCVYQEELSRINYNDRKKENTNFGKRPGYQHSICKSKNYVVMICSCQRLDFERILEQRFEDGFFGLFRPVDCKMEFIVLKENGEKLKKVCKISSDFTGQFWHISNVFEEGNEIVIEGSLSDGVMARSFLGKIRINVDKEEAVVEHMYGHGEGEKEYEFQNVHPYYVQKSNDIVFGLTDFYKETSSIGKYNKKTGVMEEVFEDARYLPSEPLVLAEYNGEEEDAIVIDIILDVEKEESFLAILDARTMSLIAKIYAPIICNHGLHTIYLPDTDLNKFISKY
eukprot:snap_masked-scaffold_12-processed-gene-1.28-mRNA-1 protein AED:1.00 eAED:1.00 QI:0/-1/0/0/-1/1/1/0/515